MKTIEQLAAAARPVNDDDWGTDRQIKAENAFFERVRSLISRERYETLNDYCLKATTDEMIDEGLRVVKLARDAYVRAHSNICHDGR